MSEFDSMQDDSVQASAPVPQVQGNPSLPPQQGMHAQPSMPQPGQPPQMPSFDDMPDDEEKYGTLGQQAKAGAEGLAQGVLGPAAPWLEKKLGVKEEDILARQNVNPIAHGVGEAVGLVGGVLTGVGEGALMEVAGKGLAKALIPEATTLSAKIGSSIVSQAAEMAILQSGNEASKMILNDPETSAQSAIMNIGLASALGGATGGFITGAVNPLWKATVGPHVEHLFGTLASKLGGVEGAAVDAEGLVAKSGLETPAEIQSVIDGRGVAEHSVLSQSDASYAGKHYQETLKNYEKNASNKIVENLGRSPESLENMGDLDKATHGRSSGESLAKEIEAPAKPIYEAYDNLNKSFEKSVYGMEDKRLSADYLADLIKNKGLLKADNEASLNLVRKTLEKLPEQENALDLKNYITNLRNNHPYGSPTYEIAKDIRGILTQAQENTIFHGVRSAGGTAEEALARVEGYQALKGEYSRLMNTIDSLNEHLHVGKYSGPESFIKALKEMSTTNPEGLANRLSGANKSNILEQLAQNFPETLAKVKDYHIDTLLDKATKKGDLNVSNLLSNIDKMSPQLKSLIASPEQHATIDAISQVMNKLKDPTHNFSNTARTVEKLMHGTPSALSFVVGMMGHPVPAILSHLGKLGFTEGRDALKLATLRFMSSGSKFDGPAFKAMTQFLHNSVKGIEAVNTAIPAVFKGNAQVLSSKMMPNKAEMKKLDDYVTMANNNPEMLMKLANGQTGYYLPGQQQALTQTAVQTVQYLQQLKPHPYQAGPLDRPIEPSAGEVARYDRALQIAQQPMVVLHHIKQGTLQANDLKDLQSMSPGLYKMFSQKLSNELANMKDNNESIPYKTKMGISLFLGQPIDTSMSPNSIIAAQPMPKPQSGQNLTQMGAKPSSDTNKLGKSNPSYMTPGQAAETRRNKG